MTSDKGILIHNIFYMLTYAFQELRQNNFEKIAGEDFDNIFDLFAEILSRGIVYQLKQGLHREYIVRHETMPSLRGKLDINGTVKNFIGNKHVLDCDYDELSVDNLYNRVLKTTMLCLLRNSEVKADRKASLKKLLLYFNEVNTIQPRSIRWRDMRFDRNSRSYRMLMYICYFILDNLLMTTTSGDYAMHTFSDEHMNRLYEKFILEYYRRHHPELQPSARQIKWNINESAIDQSSLAALPIMQTDIFLQFEERTLIIDAKYYSHSMSHHMGKGVMHSPNVYQIFSYVMNYDRDHKGDVDGMLLYAKTEDDGSMDFTYPHNDGNVIYARTLDLNQEFDAIKQQLEDIVKTYSNG